MSGAIISVEGLSKSYLVGHRARGRERYTALRDLLAREARNMIRKGVDLIRGRQILEGDEIEEFWALKDVSFEVKHGEVIGIIGRNGAGKSTLLKVLSRITEPSRGRVTLRGRVASLLEVGTGFHPELTGRENIYLNGCILGMSRVEVRKKFDEIVAFSEVEKFLDTPVKRYSSGMYVRLAFAVAAHLEPEILAVDEVLAVGDAEFQKKCLGKIGDVARDGRTVLFVSHNMNAVERLCGRVIWLASGAIRADSKDVDAVIARYLHGPETRDSVSWRGSSSNRRDPHFEPLEIHAATPDGERISGEIPKDAPFQIVVDGLVERLDPALTIGFDVYNEGGIHVLRTYQTDSAPDTWPHLRIGRNRLSVEMPAHFFNEGVYSFQFVGGLHCREWIFEPGANNPAIELSIHGKLSPSPLWLDKRPGVLGPVFKWISCDPKD